MLVGYARVSTLEQTLALQQGAHLVVLAVGLISGHPGSQPLASKARLSIRTASCGVVANSTCSSGPSGIPASAHRAGSSVHTLGRDSSRSMNVRPAAGAAGPVA